ncbi:MAG TPA: hypothetical protein VM847_12640 [Tahibacter sp.]|jgi:hypothetical protein|nr:hypothetical protein [Tahibacter sp.]
MQSYISLDVNDDEQYCFALEPTLAARALMVEQADRVAREGGLAGRPAVFSRVHVPLCATGRDRGLGEPLLPALTRAAATVHATALEVSFDRFASLRLGGQNHALVLRAPPTAATALRFLGNAIGHAQYAQGLYRPAASRWVAQATVRYLPKALEREIAIEPIVWQAQDFVLIRSARGVQDVVGRWKLAAAE